jgi:hypothetical protein
MAVDTMDPCYVQCYLLPSCCHRPHLYFSVGGVYSISTLLIMSETRSTVILALMARQMRKDTGDDRYRARSEENKPCLMSMIATSCTRPLSKWIRYH